MSFLGARLAIERRRFRRRKPACHSSDDRLSLPRQRFWFASARQPPKLSWGFAKESRAREETGSPTSATTAIRFEQSQCCTPPTCCASRGKSGRHGPTCVRLRVRLFPKFCQLLFCGRLKGEFRKTSWARSVTLNNWRGGKLRCVHQDGGSLLESERSPAR